MTVIDVALGLAEAVAGVGSGIAQRADSWVNAMIGFGGPRDKVEQTQFGQLRLLSWDECAQMYASEDLSARICDVYPREAMRLGFRATQEDLDPAGEDEIKKYLRQYDVSETVVEADIWARTFGGAAIWPLTDADQTTPWEPGEKVVALRVFDRRYVVPYAYGQPDYMDLQGQPLWFNLFTPEGGVVGRVHRSRLVIFRGALTDARFKRVLASWDFSVLQRPYNALRDDGTLWKSTQYLVQESSQGVFKIKNLWNLVAGKQRDAIQERLSIIAAGKSVARSMVLDADGEDYTRTTSTFAGLADLNDRSLKRIAAAAEIPVTVLLGEAPAGLNATGDSDLRWFFNRVDSYRTLYLQCRLEQLLGMLLSGPDSPAQEIADTITVKWPKLWSPSAVEQSTIFSQTASAVSTLIDKQVILPEEAALSLFRVDGFSQDITIDRDLRTEALKDAVLPSQKDPTQDVEPGSDPNQPPAKAAPGDEPRGDSDWDESKHPRAKDGEFSDGGGESAKGKGGGTSEKWPKEPEYEPEPEASEGLHFVDSRATQARSENFFGGRAPDEESWVNLLTGGRQELTSRDAKISSYTEADMLHVDYDSHDSDPEYDVKVHRTFYRDDEGDLRVKHDLFTLPESLQGKGIARDVLKRQLRFYDRVGVAVIELEAAWKGRAVWPAMGFRLRDENEFPGLKAKAEQFAGHEINAHDISGLARDPAGRAFLTSSEAPRTIELVATPKEVTP